MTLKKLLTSKLSLLCLATPLIVASCAKSDQPKSKTKTNQIKKDYDLGLATQPINSLNYIKYPSVNKVLPSLVEPPLKTGPNETIKRIANIPRINLGVYNISDGGTLDDYLKNNPNPDNSISTLPLDEFGAAPGSISTDQSEYYSVHALTTDSNKYISLNVYLNEGQSKWSNGDVVSADDYIDAMHYIFDLSTGSQKLTTILQSKFKSSSEMVEAQQKYIQKHAQPYKNPFAYPPLKMEEGKLVYDVFSDDYEPWKSQVEGDEAEVEAIKKAALNLGFYSGRMYWNLDNKTVLSSIPYSPDFDFEAESTILMLPNPEYSLTKHTEQELENIPQRIPTKVRKYLYFDQKQSTSNEFKKLVQRSRELKYKLGALSYDENDPDKYTQGVNKLYRSLSIDENNTISNDFVKNLKPKDYMQNRILAKDEYTLRLAYDDFQPTDINNAFRDINSVVVPINRRFVESLGGINNFGLNKESFLTNGPFNVDDLVLGPQGYILLKKNTQYYSAAKTISNNIKIFFSSDPNINAALFEDGYISQTIIPPVLQWTYWTDLTKRKYMSKFTGFGTIAFAFNLDKETNEKSYVNDINLRNAIYYAINRNELLNIVGWSSSFPVITWTAFGQAASSNGDAIEAGFEYDYSFTKYGAYPDQIAKDNYLNNSTYKNSKQEAKKHNWGIPIPVQNYTHLDHIAKTMKFETVNRVDKGFHPDVARAYLEEFKKQHKDLKQVTLRMITNSTDEQKNAAIALKDFMRKAFDGYIDIDIKNLPENVYEDWRTTGNYDILYRNFDTFGSDLYSYIRVFLKSDGINTANQKTTGFRNNPSGSWTYDQWFRELGYSRDENNNIVILDKQNEAKINDLKNRLRILGEKPNIWDKIVDISLLKNNEDINDYTKRHLRFLTSQFTKEEKEQGWSEANAIAVVAGFEKIVRETAPVIPLMEVDTNWEVSRVNGSSNLYTYSLQYAYDVENPPIPSLPIIIKN
ncbi:ABC transporter substrate-binding protein [Mycoplasmopsis mucosicanis]|uniref:ABC transporter substrate-binding protein n=1 Tax=Mycoplasmopsis mucosicanis TaxID=458208 RepID=A0A507SMW8_9BACT|nr:ABC transporter substrate-binding protein [Mycoplasmopsis mucosicanis]TQC51374.1 ABC transporter substrate-binding protein [Mycoplasmopsis mucosicanis]